MDENEKKALEFLQQAEKKLKSGGGGLFGGLIGGSGTAKAEEGIGLLERAGNAFKMAKKWQEAGDAFFRAAEHAMQIKNHHTAATHYTEAANCYRKTNPKQAIEALQKTVTINTDNGRFQPAAKQHMTIAEICESDCADLEGAIQHYEKAADFFEGEQARSSTSQCRVKMATLLAQMGQFGRAAELFEKVGRGNMENKLLQYGAKDNFFQAAVCYLCMDVEKGRQAVANYTDLFPAFADSRECKLIQKLLAAMDADDVEGFTNALKEFDSVKRMDPMMTNLFLKVKRGHFSDESDLT